MVQWTVDRWMGSVPPVSCIPELSSSTFSSGHHSSGPISPRLIASERNDIDDSYYSNEST